MVSVLGHDRLGRHEWPSSDSLLRCAGRYTIACIRVTDSSMVDMMGENEMQPTAQAMLQNGQHNAP